MDSQGRSRLIIGGLSLAAVILVISLLLTQQSARLPVMVESPLAFESTASAPAETALVDAENVEAASETPPAQVESPLAAPGPESPLASPSSAASDITLTADLPITTAGLVTDSLPVTGSQPISEAASLAETEPLSTPITVTARSTVTVTLAASLPRLYSYEVVTSYLHDPEAYTQGLQYVDGVLYEGTGLYGRSSLRRVDLESGTVEQQVDLADEYFGEGIYVLGERIYQLTWQSQVAFLYDRESFEVLDQFSYSTEGWGLTSDGQDLLMSDGSATIFRRDPQTFAEIGRFTVTEEGDPVNMLNELEYINGSLWANIWLTDEIVIIDPASGEVTARIDFAGLLPEEMADGADVLNGIAYDEENDRIFVTGKLWPLLFEIKLIPQ
jgi:glutamine cyclotransferase